MEQLDSFRRIGMHRPSRFESSDGLMADRHTSVANHMISLSNISTFMFPDQI